MALHREVLETGPPSPNSLPEIGAELDQTPEEPTGEAKALLDYLRARPGCPIPYAELASAVFGEKPDETGQKKFNEKISNLLKDYDLFQPQLEPEGLVISKLRNLSEGKKHLTAKILLYEIGAELPPEIVEAIAIAEMYSLHSKKPKPKYDWDPEAYQMVIGRMIRDLWKAGVTISPEEELEAVIDKQALLDQILARGDITQEEYDLLDQRQLGIAAVVILLTIQTKEAKDLIRQGSFVGLVEHVRNQIPKYSKGFRS